MILRGESRIFRRIKCLLVVLLLINCYTAYLYLRNGKDEQDLFSNNDFIKGPDSIDENAPSIRLKTYSDGELKILVPLTPNYSNELVQWVQKILGFYYQGKTRRVEVAKNEDMYEVSKLKSILTKDVTFDQDPPSVWKGVYEWPYSDPLRLINLGPALKATNTFRIKRASSSTGGSQLKLRLTLEGDQVAFFKPKWYPKTIDLSTGTVYSSKDRHFGEIAAFYLNLILGYHNAPIVVGRGVDLRGIQAVAEGELAPTFYTINGTTCVYGKCPACRISEPVCNSGDADDDADAAGLLEGAMILLLNYSFRTIPNPWARTYRSGRYARWETDMNYCTNTVWKDKRKEHRNSMILDAVGVAVFDFLIGNGDRHHFEVGPNSDNHSGRFILLDNGKSFGNFDQDFIDLLAPLYQCCRIREKLYKTLKKFQGQLGSSLDLISEVDPLYPLLTKGHLTALDRRLNLVLSSVDLCLERNKNKHVFV